ncbi:MAG: nuclear transport factor 2 family protein [Burkholderiales bacterium]|nr:nuclear transport factor 2 family protein [Burkholderiales bacterium]
MTPDTIARWHAVVARRDLAALDALLDPAVVFISPVVHAPQAGRALTRAYLGAALQVLGNAGFRYLGEWRAPDSAVLEFETEVDGIRINGVDMIRWGADGRIVEFKVMVRPLKAINLLHQKMAAALAGAQQ